MSETQRLSMPRGNVFVPRASEYEISLPRCAFRIEKSGNDLVLSFDGGDRLVLGDFLAAKRGRWSRVAGEKCLYRREVDGVASYQIQAMREGKRYTDTLGAVTLSEAIRIRDQLAVNRRRREGPQSWKEMRRVSSDILARDWTFGQFRKEVHLPHRAGLDRSAMDTRLMEGRWQNHIQEHFASLKLKDATERDFEEFVGLMQEKTGAATILHCLSDLRRLWTHAGRVGAISRPFPGRDAIREVSLRHDSEKKCWLTPEEARFLLEAASKRRFKSRTDHDVYCYIVLGLALGLRAGEIHKLSRQAVERHLIESPKNKRSRFAHFSFAPVAAMLAERLRLYPPGDPREPLFPDSRGQQRKAVPKKYYKLVQELGFNDTPRRKGQHLERIDFHALRHTFATLAAMRGVDHLTLMRLMGHRTSAMTLRYIEMADSHQAASQELAMKGIFDEIGELDDRKILPEREEKAVFARQILPEN